MTALHAASVLWATEPSTLSKLDAYATLDADGVPTLDTGRLTRDHPGLAAMLRAFIDRSSRVLAEHHRGAGGSRFVIAEVELANAAQRDDANGRADLSEHIAQAALIPHLAELLDEALSANPDYELIRRRAAAWSCQVEADGQKRSITLDVPAASGWGSCWGGLSSPRELRRRVTIETNHAAWRDRRVRRLVSVRVVADELWADPADVSC